MMRLTRVRQGDEADETEEEEVGQDDEADEGEADETEDGDAEENSMDAILDGLVDKLVEDDYENDEFEDGSTFADYTDQEESLLQQVLGLRGGKAMKAMKAM